MTSNATKAIIHDIQTLSRETIARIRAEADRAIAVEQEAAAALIADAIAAADPEQAKADFIAAVDRAEPVYAGPTSVLPTGGRMNPSKPETAVYFDADQTAYVVAPAGTDKATRVITSFGAPLGWTLGSIQTLRHDQTWASLGTVEVVAVIECKSGFSVGEVPNRSLSHSVFK